jgi:hypothetical protein
MINLRTSYCNDEMRNIALIALVCIILIAMIAYARADDLPACKQLRDAVTRYDVNVTIQRERVEFWNRVVRASRALRRAAGCPVN